MGFIYRHSRVSPGPIIRLLARQTFNRRRIRGIHDGPATGEYVNGVV